MNIDEKLLSEWTKYYGNKAQTIARNLLKPQKEERYWVPGEEFKIRRARGIEKITIDDVLERVNQSYSAEIRQYEGEYFIAVKLRNRPRPYRDPNLNDLVLDRIGAINALIGRRVRGKNIVTTDARMGKKYNIKDQKGHFIGIGTLVDKPRSSGVALYMNSSPRHLPDLRESELHEISALHPIPRGITLSLISDDISGKSVFFVPAPSDLGIAAMLAMRGANVYIATTLRGLLNRIKKINRRLDLNIKAENVDPRYVYDKFDYVILNPLSSDYGLRPQPYLERLGKGKLSRILKIQMRHLKVALRHVKSGTHLLYVVNTVDLREVSKIVESLMIKYPDIKPIYPGVDGIDIELFDEVPVTVVTRDEGPYFAVVRFMFP